MPLPPMTTKQRLAYALAQTERTLVEDLTKLRKRANLSATDVAKKINRHKSSISKFEARQTDPQLSTVLRYAHAIEAMVEIRVRPFSQWEKAQSIQKVAMPEPGRWVSQRSHAAGEYTEPVRLTLDV